MAVFNKNTKKETLVDSMSRNHIAHGTTVKGEINAEGVVRIDGVVEGLINSKGKVVIGQQGRVEGDIFCSEAEVEGRIDGNMQVKGLLLIKSTGVVIGDIEMFRIHRDNIIGRLDVWV